MLSIFKRAAAAITATASYPIFTRIAQVFQMNAIKVDDYYSYADYVVPSDHFLVTLVNSIAVSHNTSLETFIDLTYRAGVSAGRGIGLGSAMTPMKVLPKSHFFGSRYQEVIYLSDTEFPTDTPELWLPLSPIKFWAHNLTDLSFRRLVGYEAPTQGLSVVEINVPLLMCQFRHFNNEQLELPEEERRGLRHFISLTVVKALKSQLNVSLFNRVYATLTNASLADVTEIQGLTLQNPMTAVDTFVDQIIANTTQRTLTWENVLALIPMPYGDTALEYFRLPDQVQNRYVRSFEFVATFKVIMFLLDVEERSPGDKNTPYLTALRVYLDRAIAENLWQSFDGNTTGINAMLLALRKRLN